MEKAVLAQLYEHFLNSSGVSIDSRTLKPGQIFWALKGSNFNGHDFIKEALDKWAYLCVVDEEVPEEFAYSCFRVPDTLKVLQELATYHRNQLKIPIVAITGSNGKTTTKELLKNCLKHQSAFVSYGNLNNHIGVPYSILQIQKHHRFAIIEMGDNQPGEIKQLCKIAKPTAGLVTNIGKDHIGNYGSLESIAKSKCELYEYVLEHSGKIFVNEDDEYLKDYGKFIDAYTYGTTGNLIGRVVDQSIGKLSVALRQENWHQDILIKTHLTGKYHLYNILAAAQIAIFLQVPMGEIISGMTSYIPDNMRSQILEINHKTIILDCYNSNPSSVKANLDALKEIQNDKKIALVLGDMLELGNFSKEEHIAIAEFINQLCPYSFIGIGTEIVHTFQHVTISNKICLPNIETALNENLNQFFNEAEVIFIKGSRANQLEKLLDKFNVKENV